MQNHLQKDELLVLNLQSVTLTTRDKMYNNWVSTLKLDFICPDICFYVAEFCLHKINLSGRKHIHIWKIVWKMKNRKYQMMFA